MISECKFNKGNNFANHHFYISRHAYQWYDRYYRNSRYESKLQDKLIKDMIRVYIDRKL